MLIKNYSDLEFKDGDRVRIIATLEQLQSISIAEDIRGEEFIITSIEKGGTEFYLKEPNRTSGWKWWVKSEHVEHAF